MKPLFFAAIGILFSIQSLFGQIIAPGSGMSSNQVINISTNNAIARNGGHGTNTAFHNFASIQSLGSVNSPYLSLKNTNSTSNQKDWRWSVGASGTLQLLAENDAGTVNTTAMTATRSSTNLSSLNWFFPNVDFSGIVEADDFTVGGISIVNSTNSGIARLNGKGTNITLYGPVTVNNGDVTIGSSSGTNRVSVNSAFDANVTLNVQNHSTQDDQKTINAVSTMTLDRHITGEWSSGHFGYHFHLGGFDMRGTHFPNDSSWNIDGIGNISTLYDHQFSGTFGTTWSGYATNVFLLHNRLQHNSTAGGVIKNLRGLNFNWTGVGSVEKEDYILFPDFVLPFTSHASALYSLINPAPGVTFINEQGGVSNYFAGLIKIDGPIRYGNGSVSAPPITFENSPTTGFYRKSDGAIGITHLGTNFFSISALGVLTPTNTDSLDIGTSALEYRNIYASNFTAGVVTGIGRLAIGSAPATNLNTLIGLDYNKMIGWRRTGNDADGAWIGYSNGFFQIFTSPGSGSEPTLKQVITANSITNSVATTISAALTVAGGITTTSGNSITSGGDVSVDATSDLRFATKTRLSPMGGATNRMHLRDINGVAIAELKARPVSVMTAISANYTNNYTNDWIKITATITNTFTSAADSGQVEGSWVQVSVDPGVVATLRPFAAANQTIAGQTGDYIITGPWGGVFHADHLTNWVLMTSGNSKFLSRSDISANVYQTNLTAQWLDVSASIGLTNVLSTDFARMSLYIDDDASGGFENTTRNVALGGVALVSDVAVLMGKIPPRARWMITNTSEGSIIGSAASIVSGSCEVLRY